MQPFNKETAFDYLMGIMAGKPDPPVSEAVKTIKAGQDFLEKIYNNGVAAGIDIALKEMNE